MRATGIAGRPRGSPLHRIGFVLLLCVPTAASAELALRTQQILAHESGVADAADPLGGSWYVEALTSELEAAAEALLARVDELGGAAHAIETGFFAREIADRAWAHQREVEAGTRVVVGVNRFRAAEDEVRVPDEALAALPGLEARQRDAVARHRQARDTRAVAVALQALDAAAREPRATLFPRILDACRAGATVGEISDVFRAVAGEYRGA